QLDYESTENNRLPIGIVFDATSPNADAVPNSGWTSRFRGHLELGNSHSIATPRETKGQSVLHIGRGGGMGADDCQAKRRQSDSGRWRRHLYKGILRVWFPSGKDAADVHCD